MKRFEELLRALALAEATGDAAAVCAAATAAAAELDKVVGPGGEAEGDEELALMGRQLAALSVAVATGNVPLAQAVATAARALEAEEAERLEESRRRLFEEREKSLLELRHLRRSLSALRGSPEVQGDPAELARFDESLARLDAAIDDIAASGLAGDRCG